MKNVLTGVVAASSLLLALVVALPLHVSASGKRTPTPTSTVSEPPAPSPLAPANGAQVTVPFTISWSAVSDPRGIVAYNWQVSPSSTFSPVIELNSTSGQTQDTVSGLANGTYFWRVQAVNGNFYRERGRRRAASPSAEPVRVGLAHRRSTRPTAEPRSIRWR
jgi:hypothetical protein